MSATAKNQELPGSKGGVGPAPSRADRHLKGHTVSSEVGEKGQPEGEAEEPESGPIPVERQYTTGEVADLLQVSLSTVKKWIGQGLITTTSTLGGHKRIGQTELDRIRKEMGL